MPRSRDFEPLGRAFPGYVDIVQVGEGAFSTVYRAIEIETERPVALKALKIGALPPYVTAELDATIRATAPVSAHPNIVTLYRPLTDAPGGAVVVLELCRESFGQRLLRSGPLATREAVAVGVKIAGALETAHLAGLLHGNLKPENILVTQFGEPVVSDFGVTGIPAPIQGPEAVFGFAFGFANVHAAPEILEGQALSPATDVYGLASALYELLAGHAPFAAYDGENYAAVILRILTQPVSALPEVPIALSDLLVAALAKDPAERPQSARIFAELLRDIETEEGWPPTAYAVWEEDPSSGPQPSAAHAPASGPDEVDAAASPPTTHAAPASNAFRSRPHTGDRSSLITPTTSDRNVATPEAPARRRRPPSASRPAAPAPTLPAGPPRPAGGPPPTAQPLRPRRQTPPPAPAS
jgi:serine/threonine protein kinase